MSWIDQARTALYPEDALALVLDTLPPPETENVLLSDGLDRVLARTLPNLVDQPPFDKSGMDGFAYCPGAAPPSHAAGSLYRVVRSLAAGSGDAGSLSPGDCARIMTGAPIPAGAVAVQRVEWTSPVPNPGPGDWVRFDRPEPATNIIRRGENLRRGETLLTPRVLAPQDLGILASSGYAEIPAARRPLVGVVSTGDEIAAPGAPLAPGAIYDSNGPALCAQVRSAGCVSRFYGIVADEEIPLVDVLSRALSECDVVIVSGGVSMGDFDFVPAAFAKLGVRRVFHGLAMRPGKPTYYGRADGRSLFGMPGNPVSTFVNFEILVRPHLMARMGLRHVPRMLRAVLSEPLARRGSDRVEFLPARLGVDSEKASMTVAKLVYHGSSMLSALAEADCLLRMNLGVERIDAGEVVDVRLLRP